MGEYLLNTWYQAAWSREITDAMLVRTLLDSRVVFWRKPDGSVGALKDKCPHRFAPFSIGKIDGEAIACAYHGLKFDASGRCIHNPFGRQAPSGAKARAYPVVERDTIVWFWPGDLEKADPSMIPDFSFLRVGENASIESGYTHVKANYEIETDNLLDLSHVETVHTGTFGGKGIMFKGKFEVWEDKCDLHSNWWIPNISGRLHNANIPEGVNVDKWMDMRWNAPSCMRLNVGFARAGEIDGAGKLRDKAPGNFYAHILTPETDKTCHYFWAAVDERTNSDDPMAPRASSLALLQKAFDIEDKPLIEAVQTNMDDVDLLAMKPALMNIDGGAVRARRILASMIRKERAEALKAAD